MSESKHISSRLSEIVRDRRMPAKDRSDLLIYAVSENGVDCRDAIADVLEQLDSIEKLQEALALQEQSTLTSERFVGAFAREEEARYAIVTRGPGTVYLPATEADILGLGSGDQILVDLKSERIVGRDGAAPLSGEVVRVESRPSGDPGHVIVKRHDQLELARLHHSLANDAGKCQPGTEVVYDAERKFVVAEADVDCGGDELLVDLSTVAEVRRDQVGAPHPVVDEILDGIKISIQHPDWAEQMGVRFRRSYAFVGTTGGGKSFHLKLIATEVHDLVEQLSGQRRSRLIMVDASQFWSPYFGSTEQNITGFAKKVKNLGRQTLADRDGRPLHVPLIVVLEECEALLRSRSDGASHHLFDRPLSLLLQKTESLEDALEVPIIWLVTSNRPELVDAAALRRIGVRRVNFHTLNGSAVRAVLGKKIPESMPVAGELGSAEDRRVACIDRVVAYLLGDEPAQELAEVTMEDSTRRFVYRRNLVTPAVLEEAVSWAIDRSLRKSVRADELLGLEAKDVIDFLHKHYFNLARTLRAHNLAEYCPQWFENEGPGVHRVQPVLNPERRPASMLVA